MKTNIDRRSFLKRLSAGALAVSGVSACAPKGQNETVQTEDQTPAQMPLRRNHNTGDMVSLLGYGCMRWPMIKDENGKDIIDQEKVNEMVDYAIANGVNYFDSSPVYLQGQSEQATANALLRHPRESYFIATKLSAFRDYTREEAIAMYQRSRKIYQTDKIDYYLFHSVSGAEQFKTRFEDMGLGDYMLNERKEGRIRNLGISFHGDKEGFDGIMALHEKYHWDFVQIQMNYADWKHADRDVIAEYMYSELVKRDIPVVIMEPLLGGQLSNVPGVVAEQLKAREPQKSVASWAFRFVGSYPGVMCVLSGMTYIEHLKDNLDTYLHFKPLNDEEFELLESMASLIKSFPLVGCTACQYCMPCPYGIDIPGIFRHYNTSLNSGLVAESPEQENYKKLRRKYLTTYDKAIETVRQADHCINCGKCVSKCPQKIRIPSELRRIDQYVENLKQMK